jgi:hypothetical protein
LVKQILITALSVILALVLAAPVASAKGASPSQEGLDALTAAWWNWAFSKDPSPLEGPYTGGKQCKGEFVDGVFFLAGSTTGDPVERTCTVPANTPILFPVVNVVCSEAFGDPTPYTTCSRDIIDAALVDSDTYATLEEKDLNITRIASGSFVWKIRRDNNPFGLPKGIYDAANEGLWVYLRKGLPEGEYEIEFGGDIPNVGFRQEITYNLKVV